MRNIKIIFIWAVLAVFLSEITRAFPGVNKDSFSPFEVARQLGWKPTMTNLCGGFFHEPAIVLSCPKPLEINAATTSITASRTVSFSTTGTSQLEGDIVVTQPGRKMTANKAFLYRDPCTHQISQILLFGDVHFYESGKQLVAQSIFVDLQKKHASLSNVLYRFAKQTPREIINAWGQAKKIEKPSGDCILLEEASYTTCSPVNQTWKILASKIRIYRDKGWGEANHVYFLIHNHPLLWIPYFSFPTEKVRKTGFLFPTWEYANGDGLHIKLPYYLNLAPNYDATILPGYIYRRGAEIETHFRYITQHHLGNLNLEYLPYDRKFAYFRRTAPSVYGVSPSTEPFLRSLAHDTNSRTFFSFSDTTHFDPHWWGDLNLNYVTDDYYLQDFSYSPYSSTNDQLLNQATLNYASENWRIMGRLQTYQSLRPINQQPILDQYARLPQLFFVSDFPQLCNRLNFQINSEFVSFDHPRDFITGTPVVVGQRLHFDPSVNYPMITPYSFVIPQLQLDATFYSLRNTQYQPCETSRILPIVNLDSGLFFERQWKGFTQTLEPRLFYLFVPEKNQNNIPVFDTTLPAFNFSQLFRTNRFVGYDRLGDANQISIALTSRLLENDGTQRLRAGIGEIVYFKSPSVCLTPNCQNDLYVNQGLSPIVGEINLYLNPAWDVVGDIAVAPYDYSLNNAQIQFHYKPDCRHIFNIGYDFVRKGDTLTTYELNSSKNNLNRVNFALAWKLSDHWQTFGNLNYNLSHGHPQAYFYGFQYDSCCWAMRFVTSRIVTAENMNDLATYQTSFYAQLQLKGLGNFGNSDPGYLLTSSIFGYVDAFKG